MNISEVIKQAEKSGYETPRFRGIPLLEKMFLSPDFWQILGKSLGWGVYDKNGKKTGWNLKKKYAMFGAKKRIFVQRRVWLRRWHQFIDHLAYGKSPESFFESL